ncbi:MAG: hypothetical protein WBF53_05105 [Litorimonas sp.]
MTSAPFQPSQPREDEPVFALLGRDADAPHLLRAWAHRRMGNYALAEVEAAKANTVRLSDPMDGSDPQIRSAFRIADEMERYAVRRALEQRA